jgi:putative peptide zinc metalloprotease protein
MTTAALGGDMRYDVVPLTVQPEGDVFLVGSAKLSTFYHFPPVALSVLDSLRSGATLDDIRRDPPVDADGDTIDVDDLVATFEQVGFVRVSGTSNDLDVAASRPGTMGFSVEPTLARMFFSPGAIAVYLALVAGAVVCAVRVPAARLHLGAFFVEDHLAATLVLLLVLSTFATGLHELGHLLAAVRRGVASRLGMGTRLWNVVFEADLSGIFALPRRQRYLPLAAGMVTDLIVMACVTILIAVLYTVGTSPFLVALLQALVLQIAVTIIWQFNLFLRTDVYFIISNWSGHPNLDGAARDYIAGKMHVLTRGRLGRRDTSPPEERFLATVRRFVAIWIVGRVLALVTLFFVVLPTLARYAERAWQTIRDPDAPAGRGLDAALFAGISALLVAAGLILWLLPKFRNPRSRTSK